MKALRRISELMIAALLVAMSATAPLDAGGLRCRSDPLVLLSNGVVLDLSADVAAPLWDIRRVTYTIRVPVGVRPLLVVRTPSWPTTIEVTRVIADQPPGTYDTETTVTTRQHTEVRANLIAKLGLLQIELQAVDGWSDEMLRIPFRLR